METKHNFSLKVLKSQRSEQLPRSPITAFTRRKKLNAFVTSVDIESHNRIYAASRVTEATTPSVLCHGQAHNEGVVGKLT